MSPSETDLCIWSYVYHIGSDMYTQKTNFQVLKRLWSGELQETSVITSLIEFDIHVQKLISLDCWTLDLFKGSSTNFTPLKLRQNCVYYSLTTVEAPKNLKQIMMSWWGYRGCLILGHISTIFNKILCYTPGMLNLKEIGVLTSTVS